MWHLFLYVESSHGKFSLRSGAKIRKSKLWKIQMENRLKQDLGNINIGSISELQNLNILKQSLMFTIVNLSIYTLFANKKGIP